METEISVQSLTELDAVAARFIKNLAKKKDEAVIISLSGELGSGKTAFVKSAAKVFGLEQTVTSPTFVIEKIYKLDNQLFEYLIHIDAYRLEKGDELLSLGWNEISQNSNNIIFIEWPENVKEILPENMIEIEFEIAGEDERKITIQNQELGIKN